jgi:His-Xaa-Ser system protein HxsD
MFRDVGSLEASNAGTEPDFVLASDDGLVVRLQVAVYGFDAVARAVHRFTDRCYVHVEYDGPELLICRFKAKRPGEDLRALAGAFANEALDQMLRARLAADTEQTRLLLLAHAFTNTNILHPELDVENPDDDPAEIGAADEGSSESDRRWPET